MRGEELAHESLLDRMREKGRTIVQVEAGSDESFYLDLIQANANVGGETMSHILLRADPRVIEVWEEFLHGTQRKCGLIDNSVAMMAAEIHVKRFMVRHRRMIGISERDSLLLEEMASALELKGE